MLVKFEIDTNETIVVDHAAIIIEKTVSEYDNLTPSRWRVGVFVRDDKENRETNIGSDAVSYMEMGHRRLVFKKQFKNQKDCNGFIDALVKSTNEQIQAFNKIDVVANCGQPNLEPVLEQINVLSKQQADTLEALNKLVALKQAELEKASKPKAPRKTKAQKEETHEG